MIKNNPQPLELGRIFLNSSRLAHINASETAGMRIPWL